MRRRAKGGGPRSNAAAPGHGKILACPQCGAYRVRVPRSIRDQVWLRCRADHETHEPQLNTSCCNGTSGLLARWHPTLEGGLKRPGH